MRILITNDDGIQSEGIQLLEEIARQFSDDVWVVAPNREQSGKGHALSLTEPIRFRKVGEKHFAVDGTPTDCVMIAIHQIMKDQKPDLVLSGINRGCNLAEDMTYSGTISAAMEGVLCGVPSIALSQEIDRNDLSDIFAVSRDHAASVIKNVLDTLMSHKTCLLNINFPPHQEVKGVMATKQGYRSDGEIFIDERKDLRGGRYYWLGFKRAYGDPEIGSDLAAIRDGYISITPLQLDLTEYKMLSNLAGQVNKEFKS